MSEVCFNVSGHKIQLILSLSGKKLLFMITKRFPKKATLSLRPLTTILKSVKMEKCQAMKSFSKPSFRV